MKKWFKNMIADEDGQGMVEYGLLIGLIAIAAIVGIYLLRDNIAALFTRAGNELGDAASQ